MKKKDQEIATFEGVKDELFIADYIIFCQPEQSTRKRAPGTEHLESSTRDQAPGTKHPDQASGTSMI